MTTETASELHPPGDSAEHLLAKVRSFIDGLPAQERKLFALMIGPGIASLVAERVESSDADSATWEPSGLRADLAAAIVASPWKIVAV